MSLSPLTTVGDQFVLLRVGRDGDQSGRTAGQRSAAGARSERGEQRPAGSAGLSRRRAASAGGWRAESDVDCFAFEAKAGDAFNFDVLARRHWSAVDSVIRVLNADGGALAENDDFAPLGAAEYAGLVPRRLESAGRRQIRRRDPRRACPRRRVRIRTCSA